MEFLGHRIGDKRVLRYMTRLLKAGILEEGIFRAKLRAFKDCLKMNLKLTTPELRGHIAYYVVTDNSRGINRFALEVRQLMFKWLNRRGKRRYMRWEKFEKLLKKYPLTVPRIRVDLLTSK